MKEQAPFPFFVIPAPFDQAQERESKTSVVVYPWPPAPELVEGRGGDSLKKWETVHLFS